MLQGLNGADVCALPDEHPGVLNSFHSQVWACRQRDLHRVSVRKGFSRGVLVQWRSVTLWWDASQCGLALAIAKMIHELWQVAPVPEAQF